MKSKTKAVLALLLIAILAALLWSVGDLLSLMFFSPPVGFFAYMVVLPSVVAALLGAGFGILLKQRLEASGFRWSVLVCILLSFAVFVAVVKVSAHYIVPESYVVDELGFVEAVDLLEDVFSTEPFKVSGNFMFPFFVRFGVLSLIYAYVVAACGLGVLSASRIPKLVRLLREDRGNIVIFACMLLMVSVFLYGLSYGQDRCSRLDDDVKRWCYFDLALETGSKRYCHGFFICEAAVGGDIRECDAYPMASGVCRAVVESDPRFCEELEERDECVSMVAMLRRLPEVCERVESRAERERCLCTRCTLFGDQGWCDAARGFGVRCWANESGELVEDVNVTVDDATDNVPLFEESGSKDAEDKCDRLSKLVLRMLEEANHCNEASDCVTVSDLRCPFGCHNLVNRAADLAEIRDAVGEYGLNCPHCLYKCPVPPKAGEVGCVKGICADMRFESQQEQTILRYL